MDSTSLRDNNHILKSLPLKTKRVFLIVLTFTPLPTAGNVIEISQKLYSATGMFYTNAFATQMYTRQGIFVTKVNVLGWIALKQFFFKTLKGSLFLR